MNRVAQRSARGRLKRKGVQRNPGLPETTFRASDTFTEIAFAFYGIVYRLLNVFEQNMVLVPDVNS